MTGKAISNLVPSIYFLLSFKCFHSSLNDCIGNFFSISSITKNFAVFNNLKFLIKNVQTTQIQIPVIERIIVFISHKKEFAANNAILSVTNKLFMLSLL